MSVTFSFIAPLALFADIYATYPRRAPHPVQGIGLLAASAEALARKTAAPAQAGTAALCLICAASAAASYLLCALPGVAGFCAAVCLCWSGLALGSLERESRLALQAVREAENRAERLPEARLAVQMLVSRDTGDMGIDDLYRSLAESVSENLNDAFVAPYFWLCAAGPAGLWCYKSVSTLDSMWGYKTDRYILFGRASALADDIFAWIPARLCVALMLLTARLERLAGFIGKIGKRGYTAGCTPEKLPETPGFFALLREGALGESPNAGLPMAAAAWLFAGRCGGPTPYFGRIKQKPYLGPENGRWRSENCSRLIRHARGVGMLCGFMSLAALFWKVCT
ncbi:MAG: cobalamin biosynthesis protein [Desulfovibrio sp.]|jgi:adenosylcobinamide-phosphate synthase|nr:cobalamin biosynthesis protein [Desulfovibrio sp.]